MGAAGPYVKMGSTRLVLSCLVTSTSRAGGTQLCEALGATGAVGAPADYFNPLKAVSRSRAWKLLGAEGQFPERYLARVRLAATGYNDVCCVGLTWPHLTWLVRMARAALVGNDGASCTDAEAVAAWFPNVRYVHLRCRDTTRQALRWYASLHPELLGGGRSGGLGHTPAPDFQEVRWLETLVLQHERSWQTYFHLHGIVPEMVEYEQFHERSDETVGAIIETLGLSVLSGSARNRPSPDRHHASDLWPGQYLAVRDQLSATIGIRSEPKKIKTVRPDAAGPLKVLFCVRPYRGHLHPFVPLARAFIRAGHRVAFATGDDVGEVIASAGLTWLPAGLNPRELWKEFPDEDPDYGVLAVGAKVSDLLEISFGQFRPDVMIRDPTDLASAIASEIVGAVNVVYGLSNFIPMSSWRILGADQTIAELRRAYDLPDDPELDCIYRDLYLAVLPRSLEVHAPLPVPSVLNIRYVPWDGVLTERRGSSQREQTDPPTILMTLGTVYNTHSELFGRFIEALAGEEISVICTLGEGIDPAALGVMPVNVHFERYKPHSSILPRCQAVLCHAGFNTVMGSIMAGVPLVCVPLGSDQEYNARFCAEKGLGVSLAEQEVTPERIREAVHRVLEDPSFSTNVRTFQQMMARRPGLPAAVRRIEALVHARRSTGGLSSEV